jgi:hypothetical protein
MILLANTFFETIFGDYLNTRIHDSIYVLNLKDTIANKVMIKVKYGEKYRYLKKQKQKSPPGWV